MQVYFKIKLEICNMKIEEELFKKAIELIANNPGLLAELGDMPNIKFPTKGGKVFWNDLANYNGWRIQQNTLFKNCRILDPDNVRRAWGGMAAMEKIFEKLVNGNK